MPIRVFAAGENTDSIPEKKKVGLIEQVMRMLAVERGGVSFALYPIASYSNHIGIAVGVMPMFQFQIPECDKPSTITNNIMLSTQKMFQAQCDADIFMRKERNIVAKIEFFRMPDDYYPIGNQKDKKPLGTYDCRRLYISADVLQSLGKFELGPTFDFTRQSFVDVEADSASTCFIDNQMGWSNGLGVALAFDSRDDVLSPRHGWFARLRAMAYAPFLGSHFSYRQLTIDVRRYLPMWQQSTLALQGYWSGIDGNAPFYKMPSCGGTRLGRAISNDRKYIDRTAWLLQSELRFPLFWRLGATTFVAAGNVSPKFFDHQAFSNCHLMAGAGLRVKVFPKKNLKLRLDVGISQRGDKAVYMNIKEAF